MKEQKKEVRDYGNYSNCGPDPGGNWWYTVTFVRETA